MADLYVSRGLSGIIPSSYTLEGNGALTAVKRARRQEKQADENAQSALKTYELNVLKEAGRAMNDIAQRFQDDPNALQEQFEKIQSDMVQTIPNEDGQVSFLSEFNLRANSYLNRARARHGKIQNENLKSAHFDKFYQNNDLISLTFSNLLSGASTPDDLVNYQMALNENAALLEGRQSDGARLFTDEQRRKMASESQKAVLTGLKNAFNDMEPSERKHLFDTLSSDNAAVAGRILKNENGVELSGMNLKEALDAGTYADFKNYVTGVMTRSKKLLGKKPLFKEGQMQQLAVTQLQNAALFEQEIANMEQEDDLFGMLNLRQSLYDTFEKGDLAPQDFNKLGTLSLKGLEGQSQKYGDLGNPFFDRAFDKAVLSVLQKTNMTGADVQTKAVLYDRVYRAFNDKGYDPKTRFFKDDTVIEEVVDFVVKSVVTDQVPAAMCVDAAKVLSGDSVMDYKTKTNPSKPRKSDAYRLWRSKAGDLYKIYPDARGNYSNDSVFQRVK